MVVCVWGMLTKNHLGPIAWIEGKFRIDKYCKILKDVAIPHLKHLQLPDTAFVFQQNRSPVHSSEKVDALLHQPNITILE